MRAAGRTSGGKGPTAVLYELNPGAGSVVGIDVGRDQIQLLAALFHPGTPNDVAPGGFNVDPQPGLPSSPLAVAPRQTGFATVER